MISPIKPVDLIKKLMDIFAKAPNSNLSKLLSIAADQLRDVQETLQKIEEWRDIDKAKGTTLDLIGGNVVQKRGAATDEVYRIMIKTKIARNLSKGDVNTIIRVIAMAVGADYSEVKIRQKFNDPVDPEPAALSLMQLPLNRLNESGIELSQFVQIIQKTVAAGVRVNSVELTGTFQYASQYDQLETGDTGFADIDMTTGGTLGELYESGDDYELPI